jgi:hypothetical protein
VHRFVHSLALVAGAVVLGAAHAPVNNPIDVAVASGPYAGNYKADASDSYCMHAASRDILSVSWQSAKEGIGAKEFSLAAIDVANFKRTEPKTANAHVAFGDPQKKPFVYELTRTPVTIARSGKVIVLTVQGKTAQGVQVHITASCGEVEELP